ncbi:hypothetical protein PHSY_000191 [Pseudozyma hubeiensis SY62]|uniref:Uncharacterized protein n=1 Tax=Pseudozyma hubeiensis (strain SY62) TaxID=1305764 RepID=R9NW20_PSEHS|nr:hypothetical protein PHSY_000191 [Pseudozyma hubeiensis SY62]GAC92637.1 hypothetical protein PHSY_000191 [Pseudozyma hubeiensis SY62]
MRGTKFRRNLRCKLRSDARHPDISLWEKARVGDLRSTKVRHTTSQRANHPLNERPLKATSPKLNRNFRHS